VLAGSLFLGVAAISLALIVGIAIGGRGRRNREVAHPILRNSIVL
jgi:hypothetical protein